MFVINELARPDAVVCVTIGFNGVRLMEEEAGRALWRETFGTN
jgi:hypothetical protein